MSQGIALFATLGVGVAGWVVMGIGSTDSGPRGMKLVGIGLAMSLGSVGLATVGAVVASLGWAR